MDKLKRLMPQFRKQISEDFLSGRADIDVLKYVKPCDREVDLTPLVNVVNKAMEKFVDDKQAESDRWLAPRVHATLRLTRREAADQGVWDYLAVVALEDYVRWRWARNERAGAERFAGREYNKHAIARLWWGAELTRNGSDYSATVLLFTKQDIQNSWQKTRLFRHRPAAVASLGVLSTLKDGEFAGDEQRDLVKSFNVALTTTMLDAVARSKAVDADALAEWRNEAPDETMMYEEMPVGPPEEVIDEEAVSAVHDLLTRIVGKTNFTKRERRGAKAQTDSEVGEE